jgi:competence protein ComEC
MFSRIAASPSKTFIVLSAAFIIGTAIHAADERPWLLTGWFVGLAVAASVIAVMVWRRHLHLRLVFAVLALMLSALARYDAAVTISTEPLPPPQASRFTGTVCAEPSLGIRNTVLIMDRVLVYPTGQAVSGRVRLLSSFPGEIRYGDRLSWECRPQPAVVDGATAASLLLQDIAWQCFLRQPSRLIAAGEVSAASLLFSFKSRIRHIVGVLLPEPESSFLLGLLIGERRGIPDGMVEDFRRTGTSHILAVSGYNVSRLVDIFFILFACAAVRRRQAAGLVAMTILGFVAVVGGGASVVRAAVMGCTSLLAVGLGRRYSGLGALVAAAAIMLAANPLILRHDVGFQLSFAAVCGIHALGKPLASRLVFIPETLGLRQTMGETLAATIMTMPIILQAFGRLPLIGPLVNLLVLPLVPWAMLLGALAVLLGSLQTAVGLPMAFLAGLILRLIEWVIQAAAYVEPLHIGVGPIAAASLFFWVWLLWFALSRAKPVVLFRRTRLPEIEVEVINYGR